MRMITLFVAMGFALPSLAAERAKPGPEHKHLKALEGTWDTLMKFAGMESKGTITYKMELGGFWLVGNMESELLGTKFSGKSLDTYNPTKKKYVGIWVDSMSTAPVNMEGDFDEKKKTLTMSGEGPGMDGKPTKYRSVTTVKDEDNFEMTMYIGDGKEPTFTVAYKRKK